MSGGKSNRLGIGPETSFVEGWKAEGRSGGGQVRGTWEGGCGGGGGGGGALSKSAGPVLSSGVEQSVRGVCWCCCCLILGFLGPLSSCTAVGRQ